MIFLSHSRENSRDALKLESEMRKEGYEVLKDPPLVEGDPFWREKVRRKFSSCKFILILWSKYARKSPWVDEEIRAFSGMKIFLILDESPIPYDRIDIKVYPSELIDSLKRNGLRKKKNISFNNSSRERIAVLRSAKINEWKSRLYSLKKRNLLIFERISPSAWQTLDGTIFKSISPDHRSLKSDDKIILLSTIPVTNKLYSRFISDTNWPQPGVWSSKLFQQSEAPVVGINWYEAKACAKWLGADLPSKGEWELFAGCAEERRIFATNDNTISNSNSLSSLPLGEGSPVNPMVYPPNPEGFYGMSGNTWDWCESQEDSHFIIKGGGYMESSEFCKIKSGYRNFPIDRDCSVGFRLKYEIIID